MGTHRPLLLAGVSNCCQQLERCPASLWCVVWSFYQPVLCGISVHKQVCYIAVPCLYIIHGVWLFCGIVTGQLHAAAMSQTWGLMGLTAFMAAASLHLLHDAQLTLHSNVLDTRLQLTSCRWPCSQAQWPPRAAAYTICLQDICQSDLGSGLLAITRMVLLCWAVPCSLHCCWRSAVS